MSAPLTYRLSENWNWEGSKGSPLFVMPWVSPWGTKAREAN